MSSFLKNIHPLLKRKKQKESDPNFAILDAIDGLLSDAEEETLNAKSQSYLNKATGDYLNVWGDWFGVTRKDGESDVNYRKRIIEYVNIPRGTNQALILAIQRYMYDGKPGAVGVEIYEPWRNIFTLNKSKLDGLDGLMGDFFRFAVIQVNIGEPFDEDLEAYLNGFKTAGVKMILNYDSSIPRVGEAPGVVPSLIKMKALPSEILATMLTGSDQVIGGRIRIGDTDGDVKPFFTDVDKTNSLSVLTGSFSQQRLHYHLASLGRAFVPNLDTTMGQAMLATEELPGEFYQSVEEIDNDSYELAVTSADQLHMTLNIDNYLTNKYYGTDTHISRTKEAHAKALGSPEFTVVLSGNTPGKVADVQAFNFTKKEWVTLDRIVLSTEPTKYNVSLGNAIDYLNDNRIMFTRINPRGAFKLTLDYYVLDYRTAYGEEGFESIKLDKYINLALRDEVERGITYQVYDN